MMDGEKLKNHPSDHYRHTVCIMKEALANSLVFTIQTSRKLPSVIALELYNLNTLSLVTISSELFSGLYCFVFSSPGQNYFFLPSWSYLFFFYMAFPTTPIVFSLTHPLASINQDNNSWYLWSYYYILDTTRYPVQSSNQSYEEDAIIIPCIDGKEQSEPQDH